MLLSSGRTFPEILCHDDVIKWKHFPRYWPFVRGIHRSPVNSPHKGQWHGALMFSLICVWINDWENDRDAGDLRRNRGHCDVIVMWNHNPVNATMTACCLVRATPVLKIRTNRHVWDLWKLARSCKQVRILRPPDPWNLPATALINGFNAPGGALISTRRVLNKIYFYLE